MVLSEQALSALDQAASTRTNNEIGPNERELCGKAVRAAAAELQLDAKHPPEPRFEDGEGALHAAARVLRLRTVEKALEQHERQQAAASEVEQRFAALTRRRDELRVVEADRLRESARAGRVPEPASKKLRDELDSIRSQLDTVPVSLIPGRHGANPVPLLPFRPAAAVIEETLSEREWLAVVFYLCLVSKRVRADAADARPSEQSRKQMYAALADQPARNYRKRVSAGVDTTFSQEYWSTLRAITAAVQRADLDTGEEPVEEFARVTETALA